MTNQRCVAKALVTSAEVELIHDRMCRVLGDAGATIDAVYYLPHEKNRLAPVESLLQGCFYWLLDSMRSI